jgi:L-fuconolactonase
MGIRFFDPHVHFWDPANLDWYPMLAPDADLGSINLGDAAAMKRRYTPDTYRADAADLDLVGLVHVTVTRGSGNYLGETAMLTRLQQTDGLPDALVGGFDPDASIEVIRAELDEQAASPLLAGVRTMVPIDWSSAHAGQILDAVAERGLVFDVVAHPDRMVEVAERLAERPTGTYVLEHTGWPLRADDPDHTAQWRDGMARIAASGPDVWCKLSGLAMTLHTFDPATMRPWLETALEVFGPERCFFGSNFPVDAMFGDLSTLLESYAEVSAPLGAAVQEQLFCTNAQAVYVR